MRLERPLSVRVIFRRGPLASAFLIVLLAGSASAQWPQWGGRDRNFHSSATGLAEAWPEGGPRKLWERPLGAGYSSIVADGGLLFTMHRSGGEEVVVALDAETGATVWEHRYGTHEGWNEPPNSTPTVAGNRLYALGVSGVLSALDEESGKLAWSHDLVAEYQAKPPYYGFSASPLAHGGALIVPVGGAGTGVAAFTLADGELLWRAHDFEELYASPILIEVEGEAQVVVLTPDRVVGLSPVTGEVLWSESVVNEGGMNIATPVWSDGLLCVTAGTSGSVGLRLSKADGKTRVEKAWKNDVQIAQTTVVRAGDYLYGSSGHDPNFVTAIHAGTGRVAWKEPGFSVANLVSVDGKILLLDFEGVLALAIAGPEAWKVSSRASLLEPQAFTAPALAGKRLYLRDLKKVVALDLGKPE
jgi:outer membrane protein assembly factor BamB